MTTIYLAGFDVFRPDAVAHGKHLQQLCQQYGFIGLYPLDNALPSLPSQADSARWIYEANLALIHQADLLMANLNTFRGHEPDSGTCFEVGYAAALKKPVWGYIDSSDDLLAQIPHTKMADGHCIDHNGYTVEDFGMARNLMLGCAATIITGGPEACLAQIQRYLNTTGKRE